MEKQTVISLSIFILSTLLFTRLDFLVNSDFYHYGLQFNESWYTTFGIIYGLLYQLTIILLFLYSKNVSLFIFYEAFVLSCTQDLIFYGVWNNGIFPSGDWTWMPLYQTFGTWTTTHQILLSFLSLALAFFLKLVLRTLHIR